MELRWKYDSATLSGSVTINCSGAQLPHDVKAVKLKCKRSAKEVLGSHDIEVGNKRLRVTVPQADTWEEAVKTPTTIRSKADQVTFIWHVEL